MGELEAVLRHRDVTQGADAQVRDGQLWICHTPRQPWVAAVRIPAALAACARRWVATSITTVIQGTAPVPASTELRWRSSSPRSPYTYPRERNEEV